MPFFSGSTSIPAFAPQTVIRQWPKRQNYTIADATTGVICFGGTGSGKTSGPGKHLAIGYAQAGFGGLILTAKAEERRLWEGWLREAGRLDDLIVFDASGRHRFNPLAWEAGRAGEGGGLVINIVHLLMEIAGAVTKGSGGESGGGDAKFFEDALHLNLTELVALAAASGEPVTLPRLRELSASAPRSVQELSSKEWQQRSACAQLLMHLAEGESRQDGEGKADLAEIFSYWTADYPALSDRTRSIIDMMLSMLVQPFLFRPLRQLFTTDTTITPEACFDGKILIIDLPSQEFRLAGRVAQLAWKHCFQISVMRRQPPANGHLRPVFLWADECQTVATPFDAEYQSVARSAGGATVYLTQNRESLRRVLGSDDVVDSLLGNLQTKIFCQNSSTDTNEWAAKLFGERYIDITSRNVSQNIALAGDSGQLNGGSSRTSQKRHYLEESEFAQLRRGGPAYDHRVSALVYKGGALFDSGDGEAVPYLRLTFNQLG